MHPNAFHAAFQLHVCLCHASPWSPLQHWVLCPSLRCCKRLLGSCAIAGWRRGRRELAGHVMHMTSSVHAHDAALRPYRSACIPSPPCCTVIARARLTPQRRYGRTPLKIAVYNNSTCVADYLRSVGGTAGIMQKGGNSPHA